MKKTLLYTSLIVGNLSFSQNNTISSGGEYTSAAGNVSYSIGQIVYTTIFSVNNSITQGVQQPYEISTTIGISVININLEIAVYPNPTIDFLTLKVEKSNFENLSYEVYDLEGKVIDKSFIKENDTKIILNNLPNSIYFLKVFENKELIKTFKIIKQ